jgi:hypothetical protein
MVWLPARSQNVNQSTLPCQDQAPPNSTTAIISISRVMHETPSRDREDGRATGQPQWLGLAGFETRGRPASCCGKSGGAGGRVICPRRTSGSGNKAHAFATLKARRLAILRPFSLDLLSRLSRRGPCLRFVATMRLCRLARLRRGRPSLPNAIPSRLEAAPTAFLLTEPTARREGRPYPPSQQGVRA